MYVGLLLPFIIFRNNATINPSSLTPFSSLDAQHIMGLCEETNFVCQCFVLIAIKTNKIYIYNNATQSYDLTRFKNKF